MIGLNHKDRDHKDRSCFVTVLVERWCQETYTFHLPVGEATITFQDVDLLLGPQNDGWSCH